MRTSAILAAVMCTAVARAAPPNTTPDGFDHNLHTRDVAVTGADPIPCARCHPMRLRRPQGAGDTTMAGALVGRPDHAACFGACHGPAPVGRAPPPAERVRVCGACHPPAAVVQPAGDRRAFAVSYPPYRKDLDHTLAIGHKQHRAIACAQCHVERRGPPHRRCAGCHDGSRAAGKGPAMTACEGCHTPASGMPEPPALAMNNTIEILVTSAFSHARHAGRGPAGRACTTCHAPILDTDDHQLPRPTAADCAVAGCHDGAAAFGVTAACTKCHRDPPEHDFQVARPDARFSHATHDRVAPDRTCTSCHALASSGQAVVSGHAACAPCHANDFGLRRPTICGACHNATEPWRALAPDRLPPARTEFGATLDHRHHDGPCGSCHVLTTAAAQLRPPRNHRACTGAACHAPTGGPAPRLAECTACHRRGLAEQRLADRLAAPWSVRAMFDHAPHARSGAGAVPCTACHADLGAADVLSLATPGKATCAGCHDGTTSFKLTGTTCTRCHAGAPGRRDDRQRRRPGVAP